MDAIVRFGRAAHVASQPSAAWVVIQVPYRLTACILAGEGHDDIANKQLGGKGEVAFSLALLLHPRSGSLTRPGVWNAHQRRKGGASLPLGSRSLRKHRAHTCEIETHLRNRKNRPVVAPQGA